MSFTYDETSKEIRKDGSRVGWAVTAAAATTIIALMIAVLNNEQPLVTFFSSILPPPPGVPYWDKLVARDGEGVEDWWVGSVPVTNTNSLGVVDRITSTVGFTLTEVWDTSVISLTAWMTDTGGTVADGDGVLTWTASSAISGAVLVKTWDVIGTSWSESTITETLATASGSKTVLVRIRHEMPPTPTPTPTSTPAPTPTPLPTFTPGYTPAPWEETPYPTATPGPVSGTPERPLAYTIYMPIVTKNAE